MFDLVTDLRFVFMLSHPNNDVCLPSSTVGTVPVFTWTLQISLWQKRQRETWMDSARCGVCMKSGSKALQRRPSKTGSHSGRGKWLCYNLLFRIQHQDFSEIS